jgi:hypothetical protein
MADTDDVSWADDAPAETAAARRSGDGLGTATLCSFLDSPDEAGRNLDAGWG